MKIGLLLAGILLLGFGIWSGISLYRQKEEDKTAFDLSVTLGTIGAIFFGIIMIVKAFE